MSCFFSSSQQKPAQQQVPFMHTECVIVQDIKVLIGLLFFSFFHHCSVRLSSCPFIGASVFSLSPRPGTLQVNKKKSGHFYFEKNLISSFPLWQPFPRQSSCVVAAFSTTPPKYKLLWPLTHTQNTKQREHMWASLRVSPYRHLCVLRPLSASLPQRRTLWFSLSSWYTLRAIVPFCCELIHVPLTMLSAHFNTPTVLGAKNCFKPSYLAIY